MAGKRNRYGVNDSSQCYRIINGLRYMAWSSNASAELIAAYRKAGIRCRRQGVELFVFIDDRNMAYEVTTKWEKKHPGGRDPIKNPKGGDRWDEGSDGINQMTHIVSLVGTKKIALRFDRGKERAITLKTFRQYCKWRWSFGGNEQGS